MSLSIPTNLVQESGHPKPNSPDTPIGTVLIESDTNVTYFWTGTNWKTWEQRYKEGRWFGVATTGGTTGIFEGILSSAGAFTSVQDATYGIHQHIDSSTTINTYVGIRSSYYAKRVLNPYLRVVFRLDQISDCNFFIGWATNNTNLGNNGSGGDDMYPNLSAIGLKLQANNANFQLYHNDGTTTGTTEATPIASSDAALHTFELRALNSVPKYQYKFDHAVSWTDITTDIPQELDSLALQCWLQNTVASSKLWRLVDVYTRIDNKG